MAEDEYFKQLWADAFTAYEKETERKLTNDQTIRALKSVDDLLQHIEHQGGSFAGWRNKHSKLWSRLSACLTPATVFGGIARDSLSLTPVAAGAPLLGAVLYLITVSFVYYNSLLQDHRAYVDFSRPVKVLRMPTIGSKESLANCKSFRIASIFISRTKWMLSCRRKSRQSWPCKSYADEVLCRNSLIFNCSFLKVIGR